MMRFFHKFILTLTFIVNMFLVAKTQPTNSCHYNKNLSKGLNDLVFQIDSIFNDSIFDHAFWGAIIKSLDSKKVWYERNADKMFMPASNLKIPTGAATLLKLGPDFKYKTHLCYDGIITDSVLNGNVIVFGNGDPTLYEKFFDKSEQVFENWADTLLAVGINKINGNVIGDDNSFDDDMLGYGWTLNNMDSWYAAEINSLNFNENYVDFKIISPKGKSDSVRIIPNVKSNYFTIENRILVTDTGKQTLSFERPYNTNRLIFKGNLHHGGRRFVRSPTIHNPTLFYVTVLKEVFERNGIEVTGNAIDCDEFESWQFTPENFEPIVIHHSPPMSDMLAEMLKRSQNMYAEVFVRTLGAEYEENGSFENGKKVVQEVLRSFSIEPETYSYQDGSGLGRYNFFSPRQIATIYEKMDTCLYKDVWHNALSYAGVDGTLKRRMRHKPTKNNVHGKTGTISNVRALSGYVTTVAGERVVFAFFVNAHLLKAYDTQKISDKVIELIAKFDKK